MKKWILTILLTLTILATGCSNGTIEAVPITDSVIQNTPTSISFEESSNTLPVLPAEPAYETTSAADEYLARVISEPEPYKSSFKVIRGGADNNDQTSPSTSLSQPIQNKTQQNTTENQDAQDSLAFDFPEPAPKEYPIQVIVLDRLGDITDDVLDSYHVTEENGIYEVEVHLEATQEYHDVEVIAYTTNLVGTDAEATTYLIGMDPGVHYVKRLYLDPSATQQLEIVLENFPIIFRDAGMFNGYLVVGADAPASDVVALADTAAVLAQEMVVPVGSSKLDIEIADIGVQDLIVFGSPCHNDVMAELLGNPEPCDADALDPDQATLKLVENNGDHLALFVMGYTDHAVRRAAHVLKDKRYLLNGIEEMEACIIGNTYEDVVIIEGSCHDIVEVPVPPESVLCGEEITDDLTLTDDLHCNERGLLIKEDDITIDCAGYSIIGTDKNDSIGIYNDGHDYITIENCRIEDFERGIYVEDADETTIEGNTISNAMVGIEIVGGEEHVVTENIVHTPNSAAGIVLSNYILESEITDNRVFGFGITGITLSYGVDDTFVARNDLNNMQYGLQIVLSSENMIRDNTITDCEKGISITVDSEENTIKGNTITNNAIGLQIRDSTDNTIYNNYFDNGHDASDRDGSNTWFIEKTPGTNIIGGSYLGGNYWGEGDYTGADYNGDGFGDTPYSISGNSNSIDELPLVLIPSMDEGTCWEVPDGQGGTAILCS